jgi:hypothetical protein
MMGSGFCCLLHDVGDFIGAMKRIVRTNRRSGLGGLSSVGRSRRWLRLAVDYLCATKEVLGLGGEFEEKGSGGKKVSNAEDQR